MNDIAIKVENLSKQYRLGVRRHDTLRDALGSVLPGSKAKIALGVPGQAPHPQDEDTIWALKDVSFEVQRGEVVGIIGRNGAGKSTLLKLLSRITEPTYGRAVINGRVGSLLEVGTGFHPELTGRENIFLNGAILGMRRAEIERKFDEIVAFSEIEKFLETPVKRYSSGMYVRLAFAVAAHLEPEILLVDEVLAVGDAAFQQKCLGKMGEVAKEGRTVLLVSHNMVSIQHLCSEALILNRGRIEKIGETLDVIDSYLLGLKKTADLSSLESISTRKGNQSLKFTRVEILDRHQRPMTKVKSGQDVYFRFYYVCKTPRPEAEVHVSFVVKERGYPLINVNSIDSGHSRMEVFSKGYFECKWPDFNLTAHTFDCSLYCKINGEITDWIDHAFNLEVLDGDFFHSGKKIGFQSKFLVKNEWFSRTQ